MNEKLLAWLDDVDEYLTRHGRGTGDTEALAQLRAMLKNQIEKKEPKK